ncbi:MAG: AraC family transcriptional regulator [Candidatus Kapaibacterium sp.]
MKLYIKNMVCNRCVTIVNAEIEKIGLKTSYIGLGEVLFERELENTELELLESALQIHGFEILDTKERQTIEKIKTAIVNLVYDENAESKLNLSEYLSGIANMNYSTVSKLFSVIEGITIEKYYINIKIERIKELLTYDELTLTEVAFKLNYSSSAYLSNQFKKETGLTPSQFKALRGKVRTSLDKV